MLLGPIWCWRDHDLMKNTERRKSVILRDPSSFFYHVNLYHVKPFETTWHQHSFLICWPGFPCCSLLKRSMWEQYRIHPVSTSMFQWQYTWPQCGSITYYHGSSETFFVGGTRGLISLNSKNLDYTQMWANKPENDKTGTLFSSNSC